MPTFFEMSDPSLNRQFLRFRQAEPQSVASRRFLLTALLAEAADARKHGDHGAALAAEADARRLARQEVRQ